MSAECHEEYTRQRVVCARHVHTAVATCRALDKLCRLCQVFAVVALGITASWPTPVLFFPRALSALGKGFAKYLI